MSRIPTLVMAAICLHLTTAPGFAQPPKITPETARRAAQLPAASPRIHLVGPAQSVAITDTSASIALQKDQYLLLRTSDAITRVAIPVQDQPATLRWRLPVAVTATVKGSHQPVYSRVLVEAERGGLYYQDGLLKGVLGVSLEDAAHPGSADSLTPAIPIEVTAVGAGTTPKNLDVEHTGTPAKDVDIECNQDVDSVLVRVRVGGDPDPVEMHVPALRPRLSVDHSPGRIQGWGLESAAITVSIDQNLGAPVKVLLHTDVGEIDPDEVEVGVDAPGHATLRSRGLGGATVEATAFLAVPGQTRIPFQWPVIFLVAVLVGGALGSTAFVLLSGKQIEGSKAARWAGGLLAGIIVAVAVALGLGAGLGLPATASEAGTLLAGAAGGFLGAKILDKLFGGEEKSAAGNGKPADAGASGPQPPPV